MFARLLLCIDEIRRRPATLCFCLSAHGLCGVDAQDVPMILSPISMALRRVDIHIVLGDVVTTWYVMRVRGGSEKRRENTTSTQFVDHRIYIFF